MIQSLKNFKKYRYLLFCFVEKDIKLKYRRSILGIIWSVLNPLLMMAVITTVFSTLFRFNVPNFHLYYLSGSLIYNFISEATSGSLYSIISNAPLIKKVYIPKYIFPMEKCLFAFVNMFFTFVAIIMVMIFTPEVKFNTTAFLIIIPLLMALIFSIGLSMLLSALTVFFRDIIHLYSVFLMAWMYVTPIIYPLDDAMPSVLHYIVKFNPMYYFVKFFRDVLLYNQIPDLKFQIIAFSYSIIMLLIGTFAFKKLQDKFILYM